MAVEKQYKAIVRKIGRKWIEVAMQGRDGIYIAKVLINDISRDWQLRQNVEFNAIFEDKSTKFGENYEFTPVDDDTETARRKSERLAYMKKQKIRWILDVRKALKKGKGYEYGIEKLKELGFYDEFKDEIESEINRIEQLN